MKPLSPLGMIILGIALMVLGILVPLFMILKVIPTGYILSFLSYAASFGGLMLAIIGLAMFVNRNRHIDYH